MDTTLAQSVYEAIRLAEKKLEEGRNYLPYFDSYLNIETYTYVTNFCDFSAAEILRNLTNKPEAMHENLIPISEIGNGDFLCIDNSDQNLSVYYWCHELSENNVYPVVNKLTDLSDKLLTETGVAHLE